VLEALENEAREGRKGRFAAGVAVGVAEEESALPSRLAPGFTPSFFVTTKWLQMPFFQT